MLEGSYSQERNVPYWFWAVAVLATVWNAIGVFDFLMAHLSADYLAQMSETQRAYFASFPLWYTVIWASTVLMALASSVALLFRKHWALTGFAISLGLYVISSLYHFGVREGASVMGPTGMVFSVVIALSLLAFWAFSQRMIRRGILR